jgi:hypothetical protein
MLHQVSICFPWVVSRGWSFNRSLYRLRWCNGLSHHRKTILRGGLSHFAPGNTGQTETPPPIMQPLFSWFALSAFFAWQKVYFPDCRPREIPSKSYNSRPNAAAQPAVKSGTSTFFVFPEERLILPIFPYYELPDHHPEAGAECPILTQTNNSSTRDGT